MEPNPEEKQMEQKTEEEDTEVVVPEKEALEQETSDTADQPAEEPEKPLLQARRSLMYFFWPLILTILYVPAGLCWMAYRFLQYKSQVLLLTNKRVVLFKGILKKKQYMFSLELAAKAIVTQGFLGRKAGYGTVSIIYQKKEYAFDYVRDPQAFVEACKKAYEDTLDSVTSH
ncbi:PH domain-containing protein [Acidaminococcus timonensis]|uniref:PH domain-containing protein n=1 Tax=Acidaminococcus timonensis TaxID=1871002 RepID=UPI002666B9E1|nr:PH domain-containing protein [uncultured Acidaminococcus sp.]